MTATATPLNTIGFARAEVADGPVWVEAPPYGYGRVGEAPDAVAVTETADAIVLENGRLRAELGRDGLLRSLVELGDRPRGAGRRRATCMQLYDDRPTAYDAWDVDPFHLETVARRAAGHVVHGDPRRPAARRGGVRAADRPRQHDAPGGAAGRRLAAGWSSTARSTGASRNTMLKVLFPVAVHAPNATYQMQFGHAERPTHYSTSHDLARYEVPGHRFADLSEHGFGVALLTDCKYGYSTYGNEMRISLLRSPQMPDPDADVGQHEFAYAVMPHAGGWREAGVVAEAARFESPIRWAPAAEGRSFFAVDDPNLVLDTVKRAEDSDALVLRLYECHGARGTARLRVGVPFTAARRCNLLEDAGRRAAGRRTARSSSPTGRTRSSACCVV